MANNMTGNVEDYKSLMDAYKAFQLGGGWSTGFYGWILKGSPCPDADWYYDYISTPVTGVTAVGKNLIAGVEGLQEALDYYQQTGDYSQVRSILEANNDAAAEASITLGTPARAEVQTIQGLMFIVYYDEEGNVLPITAEDFLGEAPVEGLTEWQQAQVENWVNTLALEKKQLDWQIEQWGQELGLSREELNLQKEQFEADRGLSREQFEWEKEQFAQQMGFAREELALEKERLAWEEKYGMEQLEEQRRQTYAQLAAEPGNWIEAYVYNTGGLPPAPNWLPQYAPGAAGPESIMPKGIKLPSAQAYSKMPSGQRAMLGGYARYAQVPGAPQGQSEIEQKIAWSLPQQREKTATWQPAFQV